MLSHEGSGHRRAALSPSAWDTAAHLGCIAKRAVTSEPAKDMLVQWKCSAGGLLCPTVMWLMK